MQVAAGWSRRRYIPGLPGFDNEALANHYLNASANWHKATNTLGVTYTFNYDLRNDAFLQQRYLAYYNAQCCGINVEYQTYNFSASVYNQYTAVNAGQALQHLVHAGGHRHIFEPARRVRRTKYALEQC